MAAITPERMFGDTSTSHGLLTDIVHHVLKAPIPVQLRCWPVKAKPMELKILLMAVIFIAIEAMAYFGDHINQRQDKAAAGGEAITS